VIDKLKYWLVLPLLILIVAMAMARWTKRHWKQIALNKWCCHLEYLSKSTLPSAVASWKVCEEFKYRIPEL